MIVNCAKYAKIRLFYLELEQSAGFMHKKSVKLDGCWQKKRFTKQPTRTHTQTYRKKQKM